MACELYVNKVVIEEKDHRMEAIIHEHVCLKSLKSHHVPVGSFKN